MGDSHNILALSQDLVIGDDGLLHCGTTFLNLKYVPVGDCLSPDCDVLGGGAPGREIVLLAFSISCDLMLHLQLSIIMLTFRPDLPRDSASQK